MANLNENKFPGKLALDRGQGGRTSLGVDGEQSVLWGQELPKVSQQMVRVIPMGWVTAKCLQPLCPPACESSLREEASSGHCPPFLLQRVNRPYHTSRTWSIENRKLPATNLDASTRRRGTGRWAAKTQQMTLDQQRVLRQNGKGGDISWSPPAYLPGISWPGSHLISATLYGK